VAWLLEGESHPKIDSVWQPGSRAVLVHRKRGKHIIVTSRTKMCHHTESIPSGSEMIQAGSRDPRTVIDVRRGQSKRGSPPRPSPAAAATPGPVVAPPPRSIEPRTPGEISALPMLPFPAQPRTRPLPYPSPPPRRPMPPEHLMAPPPLQAAPWEAVPSAPREPQAYARRSYDREAYDPRSYDPRSHDPRSHDSQAVPWSEALPSHHEPARASALPSKLAPESEEDLAQTRTHQRASTRSYRANTQPPTQAPSARRGALLR
jgi:hypothetical protein